ncbi:hypothetical protein RP20_CCG004617 [Aedes albopictus]|nr:hypothetical protein RP20_CCG004617 [Aedes albopictus]
MEIATDITEPYNINDLPPEVCDLNNFNLLDSQSESLMLQILCNIFNSLTLNDVKIASLVCHRWNRTIFAEPIIKRFNLVLDLNGFTPQLNQFLQTLEQSDRAYRNVILKVNRGTPLTKTRLEILKLFIQKISQYSFKSLYFNMAELRLESCDPERSLRTCRIQVIHSRNRRNSYLDPFQGGLGMSLKLSMLTAICESTPDLDDLVISGMTVCNPKPLGMLPSLKQLQYLVIRDYYLHGTQQTPRIVLPNLESLSLINVSEDANYFFKVDNLKRLYIHTNSTDATKIMKLIADNFSYCDGINVLCLYFSTRTIRVDHIVENLQRLPQLTTLELGGVDVSADLLNSLDPSNRLHKVIFVRCHMKTLALVGLKDKLGTLEELTFRTCLLSQPNGKLRKIERHDLEPLKRTIPSCRVTLVYD